MFDDLPQTLNSRLMAKRLGVPAAWLLAEAKAGRLSCLPAGNTVLFVPAVVERELAERASTPTPGGADA